MKTCVKCGAPLPIQTGRGARRKMCETCSPSRVKRPVARKATKREAAAASGALEVTRRDLEAAGMLDTHIGAYAIVLATRLENSSGETAAGLAQLVKQLRETMASALAHSVPDEIDPVDELRARRESRGA